MGIGTNPHLMIIKNSLYNKNNIINIIYKIKLIITMNLIFYVLLILKYGSCSKYFYWKY